MNSSPSKSSRAAVPDSSGHLGRLSIRDATIQDAELLRMWRNDPQTRENSRNRELVTLAEHTAWLQESLNNSRRRLLIVEQDGIAVGTVRLDRGDELELSWTVSPKARGRGIGRKMVCQVVSDLKQTVVAYIRDGNIASEKIAQAAGFSPVCRDGDMVKFQRKNR